jgi:hypothetical protein
MSHISVKFSRYRQPVLFREVICANTAGSVVYICTLKNYM